MRRSAMEERVTGAVCESDELAALREMVQACIQCGTCTGSCPNAFAMDRTPRQLWRLVLMGRENDIFHSQTFCLCSVCYSCSLRCPRGLPLTETMSRLKQAAARRAPGEYRSSTLFYRMFVESVRRHGRVREMEFMTLYFSAMKSPFLPLRFAALGLKLMAKGKVSLQLPSKGTHPLEGLFKKAQELEGRP